ncbi:hypothetical protein ACF06X_23705 [Streptomyces sp. NPDC015346]|uniref:hypothetical protein n=1 Tax=Streptomyces sp. NPDC015346 TaxID=3364954 RepID=UPI0036FCB7BB
MTHDKTSAHPRPCEGASCAAPAGAARGRAPAGAGGGRLCVVCRHRLAEGLRRLPALHEACGQVLTGGAPGGLRERTTGGALPGLPFNGAAAEVRSRMRAVLGSWGGLVAQQRSLPVPPRTVAALAGFLLRNADWLAAHPAAGAVSAEIAALVRDGHRIAYPDERRRIRLGACAEPGCTGKLTVSVSVGTRGPAGTPEIRCDADADHVWPSERWSALHRAMVGAAPGGQAAAAAPGQAPGRAAGAAPGQVAGAAPGHGPGQAPVHAPGQAAGYAPVPTAGHAPGQAPGRAPTAAPGRSVATARGSERWLTAADIAALWRTPVGSVYRLASEQRWRRHKRRGRTYYSERDAHAYFERRSVRR